MNYLILNHTGRNIIQLSNTHSGSLPDIGILILQALAEWFTQILGDLVHSDTAHGADGQGPDQRVRVLTVLEVSTWIVSVLCIKRKEKQHINHTEAILL